jgi:hypothetical protein
MNLACQQHHECYWIFARNFWDDEDSRLDEIDIDTDTTIGHVGRLLPNESDDVNTILLSAF